MKYKVRLIYPSGTVRDVFQTNNKDEAEGYIKTSKGLRLRVIERNPRLLPPDECGLLFHVFERIVKPA